MQSTIKLSSAYRQSINYEINSIHIKWSDEAYIYLQDYNNAHLYYEQQTFSFNVFLYQTYKGLCTNHI